MNEKTAGNRGLRRAGALAVAAAVAVLATACGGGSAPSSASPPTYAQVRALAQCMRGHGVPDFPDPNASGGYTLTSNGSVEGAGGSSIDIDSSQAQAAYGDCRHLLPGGPSISQLEQLVQQEQQAGERHDVPFWLLEVSWWLIRVHAARPSSRRARWLVRCRSSGVPVQ